MNYYDNFDFSFDFSNDYNNYNEGANLDIRSKLKEAEKIYRKNMKDVQKALKAGKYNEARKNIETMRRSIADIREDIEHIDAGSLDSIVWSMFSAWTVNWVRYFINILLAIPTLGLSLTFEGISQLVEQWGRPIAKHVNNQEITSDDFNFYKNSALERLNYLLNVLKRLDKKIDQYARTKGKNVKKTATEVKESVYDYDLYNDNTSAMDNFKRALYEASQNGLISTKDREDLISNARMNLCIESANDNNDSMKYLSNDDRFKKVRKILYERCNNREITLDEREELLLNARRKFF